MRLTLIGEEYGCVKPLFDGTVQPEGVELVVTRSPSPQAMRRQLTSWEFDICEIAFGAYLIARSQGADVVAIPAFPRRAFFHTHMACHADAGIRGPGDFADKRVGIPEYVQSATLWARGVLEHDFGLDASRVTWYVERAGAQSTGTVLGFQPPAHLDVRQTPGGKTLVAMLEDKELDAALIGAISRTPGSDRAHAVLRPLFADPVAEGKRCYRAHGYAPANHTYMIRGELVRRHPSLARSLMHAFEEARRLAQGALPAGAPVGRLFGNEQLAQACAVFAGDAFAYGAEPNRAMLETVVQLCQEQGLVSEAPPVEALFAPDSD